MPNTLYSSIFGLVPGSLEHIKSIPSFVLAQRIVTLSSSLYFQWSNSSRLRSVTTSVLHFLSYVLVALTAPLSLFFVLRKIREYERAVVLGTTLAPVSLSSLNLTLSPTFPQSIFFLSERLAAVRRAKKCGIIDL